MMGAVDFGSLVSSSFSFSTVTRRTVCGSSRTGSAGGPFQIESASHSTRSRVGLMFKLGQKTRSRFPSGILVSRERAAVTLMSSTTVQSKSRFSAGSLEMRKDNALT